MEIKALVSCLLLDFLVEPAMGWPRGRCAEEALFVSLRPKDHPIQLTMRDHRVMHL